MSVAIQIYENKQKTNRAYCPKKGKISEARRFMYIR